MKFIFLSTITLLLLSCSEQTKQKKVDDNIKTKIMVIHDEVMPATSHLLKLRSSLQKKIETNSNDSATLQLSIDSLLIAHDKMMEWMKGYDASHDLNDSTYFIKQKQKITIVNQLYSSTILSAEQKLAK
jgi:hypothetical protein